MHNKIVDLFTFIDTSRNYEEIIEYCFENGLEQFLKDYQLMIVQYIKELKKES